MFPGRVKPPAPVRLPTLDGGIGVSSIVYPRSLTRDYAPRRGKAGVGLPQPDLRVTQLRHFSETKVGSFKARLKVTHEFLSRNRQTLGKQTGNLGRPVCDGHPSRLKGGNFA